ncbi:MAG TPA: DUF1501 domain-containing protein [Planctomycetota bacterium]|nr:DUF1501 domain-containing protein [Planctomycetota bacterium]
MLTILGPQTGRFCDGLSRRTFLRIGGLALGGMSLPDILRAESLSAASKSPGRSAGNSHKAVIMVFLPGGPPHQDMFDLKMDAPSEIRGEFKPIPTNVPGIEICEHFPRIASMMDKFVAIRSIVGANGDHYSVQCFSGRTKNRMPQGGWPSMGSVLSKLEGQVHPGMPTFVGLAPKMGHMPWADPGQAGFLGVSHSPFQPEGDGKADMVLQGISLERLADRKALLASFDSFRRDADARGLMEGMDSFHRQAFGVLTSGRLAAALDLEQEDRRTRDRYGYGVNKLRDDGGPRTIDQFLLARRLVEAGVRCVTLAFSRWDWHGQNFQQGREDMPLLDQAVSALVEDLHQRGLDKDVSVVVWGEFGRTPQINKDAGRDHWPQVSCALLACGGMKTGQVIGSTDRLGAEAKDRPVTFQEVHATLYHNLGIDVNHATVRDLSGRPHYLVDNNTQPMRELV